MTLVTWVAAGVISTLLLGAPAGAQAVCTPVATASLSDNGVTAGTTPGVAPSRAVLIGALSGRRIAWVNVVTLSPEPLPGSAAILDGLHVRTRPKIVRRELLFAPSDTVDSLRVSESLRRLRHVRYIADVQLAVSRADTTLNAGQLFCVSALDSAIGITVTTRDAWSTRPTLRAGTGNSGSVVGVEEQNVAGTGRVAKAYLRTDNGRLGAGLGYIDPWLFGHDVVGSVSRDVFRDGTAWRTSVRTHERSVFDPWVVELALAQSAHSARPGARASAADTVRRRTGHLFFDRLVTKSQFGATRFLFGVEGEKTSEVAAAIAPVLGPLRVHRSFAGLGVGIGRHTAQYELNDWLLPHPSTAAPGIADIPDGAEGEAVVVVGRDFLAGRAATHLDGWVGQMWGLGRHTLVTGDAWASGFRTGPEWSAATVRGALGAYREGVRGLWIAHIAAEELTDPDPTVRTLSTFDPTVPSLPRRSRLAESAVTGSLERTLHLRVVTHSYMLDAAAFGAVSSRWNPASTTRTRFSIAVIGAGLRLSPMREGVATLRLDVGFPVMRSAGLSSRPFVALGISPWLGAGRQRAGRGSP